MSPDQIHKLTHAIIHQELPKHRGQEAILDIVTFAQEWLEAHATPRPEVVGSLAMQMNQRALDEEKVSFSCLARGDDVIKTRSGPNAEGEGADGGRN